ncbi:MAG TPA: YchJ family metal-binding protein [Methylophilaceae bacterium]|nr:YchJ family metal-binding protein [Methylophilaceae bacterium]
MTRAASDTNACPCGSGLPYASCCAPLHDGRPAPNAEALMRSRYTAYVLKLEDYLLQTWHPDTRPAALDLAEETSTKWLGLEVKRFEVTGDDAAIVEFVARYKLNGKAEKLQEISRFVKFEKWYYLAAELVKD